MFVQSKATTHPKRKDGLCLEQRRGGHETLVQWANGDQQWVQTVDLDSPVVLINKEGMNHEEAY